ncbi:MAG TPA: hypothetical protein DDW36_03080 [Candidatus Magasanikbacteria bacterium]|nr:hypothetical protein [Candidatus Magasanikbacteria bacterium]
MRHKSVDYVFALLRLGIGWIFLWAFLDKVFALGFSTQPGKGWLSGFSPTEGFLKFATKGPFAELYQSLAGIAVVDWLFMLGLLLIGLAFMLGMGMRIATYSGVLMYAFMYTAGFIPPEHNPFLDEHIMFPLLMIGLNMMHAGRVWGLGAWWSKTQLVKKFPIFE